MRSQVWQDFFQNFQVDIDQNLPNSSKIQNLTKLAQITKILKKILRTSLACDARLAVSRQLLKNFSNLLFENLCWNSWQHRLSCAKWRHFRMKFRLRLNCNKFPIEKSALWNFLVAKPQLLKTFLSKIFLSLDFCINSTWRIRSFLRRQNSLQILKHRFMGKSSQKKRNFRKITKSFNLLGTRPFFTIIFSQFVAVVLT